MENQFISTVQKIATENDFVGGILILNKKDNLGQVISQYGLNHNQIRECLSIACYYNEKIELEKN